MSKKYSTSAAIIAAALNQDYEENVKGKSPKTLRESPSVMYPEDFDGIEQCEQDRLVIMGFTRKQAEYTIRKRRS